MAQVMAVLMMYESSLAESGGPGGVPIGASADSGVVALLAERLLEAAWGEAERWRDIDAGIHVMKLAEAERLGRVLRLLLPAPGLRLVKR